MYKLFLALRYLRDGTIAYVAIGAVTLCVAMVLVVMSVMGGWLEKVMENARGLLGDVIVDNRSYSGIPMYEEFLAEVRGWPEVEAATPVIYTYGLFRIPGSPQTGTVRVIGIHLDEVIRVNAFGAGLFYERFYPGTTTLAPQQQPMLGRDVRSEPLEVSGDRVMLAPGLPDEYRSALETARQQAAASRAPLVDTESTPTEVNDLLLRYNRPEIPGVFELQLDADGGAMIGEPHPGVIVGRDIFCVRESDGRYTRPPGMPKGHPVILTLWASSIRGDVDAIPKKQIFRYADDSRTGIYEIDSQSMYIDFDLLQQLLEWNRGEKADGTGFFPPRCSQIQIKARPGLDPEAMQALCRRMEATYHAYANDPEVKLDTDEAWLVTKVSAVTWQESQAHIIGPVQKERMLVTILFGIISLVAVALVLCILYMIVLQKTRDIGIVKSLGGSSTGVAAIFVLYGAVVGVIGAALGLVLGTTFVAHINDVQEYLIALNPAWRVWDLKVYSFDTIPDRVDATDAAAVVILAILASTVGSVAAAWRAGIMHPVEALRYE